MKQAKPKSEYFGRVWLRQFKTMMIKNWIMTVIFRPFLFLALTVFVWQKRNRGAALVQFCVPFLFVLLLFLIALALESKPFFIISRSLVSFYE